MSVLMADIRRKIAQLYRRRRRRRRISISRRKMSQVFEMRAKCDRRNRTFFILLLLLILVLPNLFLSINPFPFSFSEITFESFNFTRIGVFFFNLSSFQTSIEERKSRIVLSLSSFIFSLSPIKVFLCFHE